MAFDWILDTVDFFVHEVISFFSSNFFFFLFCIFYFFYFFIFTIFSCHLIGRDILFNYLSFNQ